MNTLKILVTSQKGGVGKSTIAANIAAYFATLLRKQVTLIDFDHQGTSSTWVRRAHVPNLQIKICDVLSVRRVAVRACAQRIQATTPTTYSSSRSGGRSSSV